MIAFPSWITLYPQEGGYGEGMEKNAVEFAPEVGPPIRRRRSSISNDLIQFTSPFFSDTMSDLMNFYRWTCADGTLSFTMIHPRTGTLGTWMWVDPPKLSRAYGLNFEIAVSLRLLSGGSYQPTIGGLVPQLYADFVKQRYFSPSGMTSSLADWIAQGGLTGFARASTATYYDAGSRLLKTAALNEPRFHTNPGSGQSGLLMEGSRTNLLLYSEQLDQASAWTVSGVTVAANFAVGPDGNLTADKLVEDTSNAQHNIRQVLAGVTIGQTYALSVFAKAAERHLIGLTSFGEGTAVFDLAAGTVNTSGGLAGAFIEPWPNGWYRCIAIITKTNTTGQFFLTLHDDSNNTTYLGVASSGAFFIGAQVELASTVSSYIPTTTVAVTRAADTPFARGNADNVLRQSEGTVFLQAVLQYDTGGVTIAGGISDGTTNNIASLYIDGATDHVVAALNSGGATQCTIGAVATYTYGTSYKQAFSYKVNDFSAVLNGGAASTDTSGSPPASLSQIDLGSQVGNLPFFGLIQAFGYFNTRQSDANMQAMTA